MGKLQGVADTLYIPLTARIQVSKRFPDFFYDEAALSLEKELPDDSIEKNSGEYFYMASVCRYHVVDAIVKAFTERHEACNVVNLGAGLETSYFRLKPEKAVFYEMDLPEVIRARREVLGEQERDILIEGDLFDLAWSAGIDRSLPTILTVSGVFQYFHEEKIRVLIAELKDAFPKGELVFDAMNERAIAYANRYVRKTGNKNAEMYFYVDDPASFGEACGIRLIAQKAFFTEARSRLKNKLKLFTRIAMKVVDEGGRRGYILHYALQ